MSLSLLLLAVIAVTWAVTLRCYGPFSFVTAGTFCFSVYSIPALTGMVYPFDDRLLGTLLPASTAAVAATTLAWSVFCLTIAIPLRGRRTPTRSTKSTTTWPKHHDAASFIAIALCLCIAGYLAIAVTDGPLFFLAMRDEQSQSFIRLLWRWTNAIGLVAAVAAQAWVAAAVFATAVIMYFLAGDRTVIIITAFCLLVLYGQGRSLRLLLRPQLVLSLVALVVVGIFGKPIYLAIKVGSFDLVMHVANQDLVDSVVMTFEPLTTFYILDLVITRNFVLPISTLLENVVGQLLIIPSVFGLDGNSFNAAFTARFVPNLSFGVAGNFWAQGWAIAGPLGVGVFAVLLGLGLRLCDRGTRSCTGVLRLFCALSGATVAVYAHRNALDNLLSFVRQIGMVVVLITAGSKVLAPFYLSTRTPAPQRNLDGDPRSGAGTKYEPALFHVPKDVR